MNVKEFVAMWKRERDELYSIYVSSKDLAVSKIINDLNLEEKTKAEVHKAIDYLLTDTFYTFLMALDGCANIGGIQQPYKLYDEDGNLIYADGDLEAEAYEQFHGE